MMIHQPKQNKSKPHKVAEILHGLAEVVEQQPAHLNSRDGKAKAATMGKWTVPPGDPTLLRTLGLPPPSQPHGNNQ